ncbi:enoyl-CoA hydratase [Legionella geestiana]|uniref:Enoyl-CoA hydratase n=1 Tax=Legionella geestiana TaxID=45065 RepID=A0A0W0TYY7_9GAMM|nr:enoyl-CoA hydratase-related protein [Legionella geestiana]KTD00637.1 enoyl-CoA hydratase [Legionella geestiana]QBS11748.1 gamma-carboxygeranoyl-CoA hydratase [Legionella geestiana]QDQ40640.1 gamma-carboxygeranoyl-CoA hydratase [Legionella geestiana]STX53561.1 enoyl-CoA hydratase [Legionella geestiana]
MNDDLVCEQIQNIRCIALNRTQKHNAFDDTLLLGLQAALESAIACPETRVIVLGANGTHFSAGADLAWMQRMTNFSEAENLADARVLARVMHTLYHSPKPTLAKVQGSAFGGGVGLIAACDMAIASETASFCFSETRLGLIPAVISPYVIEAMGARQARRLFMSAERFSAQEALTLGLLCRMVDASKLDTVTMELAETLARNAPNAVAACKQLVSDVANRPIDEGILELTARKIAQTRVSAEGQEGLRAFLAKRAPDWSKG